MKPFFLTHSLLVYRALKIVFSIFIVINLNAQNKAYEIKGTVRDKASQQSIISATITAFKLDKDTLLTTFGLSDTKGNYRLLLKKENSLYRINVKAFGYEEQIVECQLNDTTTTKRYDFELVPMPIQLNEVVVKAQVPIRSNGDTTIYNASSFRNGSEKSVEDLLKKLPGTQIREDGKIIYNGKIVQKVFLEGEDFFGKKYELVTRNLGADLVEKIEAIDNYSENPLLADIRKSGQVALNLTIRPDRKLKVFGNVAMGVGHRARFETSGALFSLVNRLKVGIIESANNIGYDPISTTQANLEYEESDFKGAAGTDTDTQLFIQNQFSSGSNLNARRSRFNQVGVGGLNVNYRINTKLRVKAFGYYSQDKQRLTSLNEQLFFSEQGNISVRDSAVRFRQPKLFTGQLRMDYQPTAKTNFQFISTTQNIATQTSTLLESTNPLLSESVKINGEDNSFQSNYQLKIVHRLKGKTAFLFETNYSHNNTPQNSTIQSGRYANYFNISGDYNKLFQQIKLDGNEFKSSAGVKGATSVGSYTLGVSFFQKNEHFNSEAGLLSTNPALVPLDSSFINNSYYSKKIASLEGLYSLRKKKWQLSAGGVLQAAIVDFDNIRSFQKQLFFFNPNVSFNRNFGNKRLSFQYSRSQSLPSLNEIVSSYVLRDYRSFQNGTPAFNLTRTERVAVSFLQSNYSKLYAYWLTFLYNNTRGSYIHQLVFSNLLNFQTAQPIDTPIHQYTLMWQLDRLIYPISTKIRWESFLSQFDQINVLERATLRKNQIQSFDNNLYFISAFEGSFNFEASSHLSLYRVVGFSQSVPVLWKPKITFFFKPTSKLNLSLTGEYYSWSGTSQNTSTFFSDLRIGFNPKNPKWVFNFDGTNLLNNRVLLFNQISNVLISNQLHYLQPRILMIRAERKF